jgi:hypothetical protein
MVVYAQWGWHTGSAMCNLYWTCRNLGCTGRQAELKRLKHLSPINAAMHDIDAGTCNVRAGFFCKSIVETM